MCVTSKRTASSTLLVHGFVSAGSTDKDSTRVRPPCSESRNYLTPPVRRQKDKETCTLQKYVRVRVYVIDASSGTSGVSEGSLT